jgi:hypothetical protein
MRSVHDGLVDRLMAAYGVPRPEGMGQLSILVGQLCAQENIKRDPRIDDALSDLIHHARRKARHHAA